MQGSARRERVYGHGRMHVVQMCCCALQVLHAQAGRKAAACHLHVRPVIRRPRSAHCTYTPCAGCFQPCLSRTSASSKAEQQAPPARHGVVICSEMPCGPWARHTRCCIKDTCVRDSITDTYVTAGLPYGPRARHTGRPLLDSDAALLHGDMYGSCFTPKKHSKTRPRGTFGHSMNACAKTLHSLQGMQRQHCGLGPLC